LLKLNFSNGVNSKMSLTVILGPMFGGKTKKLVEELVKISITTRKKPLLITHILDQRDPEKIISSHFPHMEKIDGNVDIVKTDDLSKVDVFDYSVVGVEEAQFFPHLVHNVKIWLEQDKHVLCAGLKASAQMKKFGEVIDLIPMSDVIHDCKAVCVDCMNEGHNYIHSIASHTLKIQGTSDEIDPGGEDKYKPVCRKHYRFG